MTVLFGGSTLITFWQLSNQFKADWSCPFFRNRLLQCAFENWFSLYCLAPWPHQSAKRRLQIKWSDSPHTACPWCSGEARRFKTFSFFYTCPQVSAKGIRPSYLRLCNLVHKEGDIICYLFFLRLEPLLVIMLPIVVHTGC